jgi:hypothetical protein
VTVDQIAARYLGTETPIPSLELCGEPGGMISFRTPEQPLPMEVNPRKVFYSMFGQGDTTAERRSILDTTNSLLDYVQESTVGLSRKLDAGDRAKVSDYLDSVREIVIACVFSPVSRWTPASPSSRCRFRSRSLGSMTSAS